MNEVFELQIKREQSEDGKPVFVSVLELSEKANAAKHADALADALADLLDEIYNGGATRYTAEIAAQELAAYRGEK